MWQLSHGCDGPWSEEFRKIVGRELCTSLLCWSLHNCIDCAAEFLRVFTAVVDGGRPVWSKLHLVELTLSWKLPAPGFSVGVETTATVDLLQTTGSPLHRLTLVIVPASTRTTTERCLTRGTCLSTSCRSVSSWLLNAAWTSSDGVRLRSDANRSAMNALTSSLRHWRTRRSGSGSGSTHARRFQCHTLS